MAANFRTSNLPEFNANITNGYFQGRSAKVVHDKGCPFAVRPRGVNPNGEKSTKLPKSGAKAASQLKRERVWEFMFYALLLQFIIQLIYIIYNPTVLEGTFEMLPNVWFLVVYVGSALLLMAYPYATALNGGIMLMIVMVTFAITWRSPHPTCIQEVLVKWSKLRNLSKPFCVLIFACTFQLYCVIHYDTDYRYTYLCYTGNVTFKHDPSITYATKDEEVVCYFYEFKWIVSLALNMCAIDFLHKIHKKGELKLRLHSLASGYYFDECYREVFAYMLRAARVAVISGVVGTIVGYFMVPRMIQPMGYQLWEPRAWEKMFLHVQPDFWLRLMGYPAATCGLMYWALRCIIRQYSLTWNLPVTQETAFTNQDMLLHEGMDSDVEYIRLMAFDDFTHKIRSAMFDNAVFYSVSHPGSNPQLWRAIVATCIKAINGMTEGNINFMRTTPLPENFFDSSFGQNLVNQMGVKMRRASQAPPVPAQGPPRAANQMRDLTATANPDRPNVAPTFFGQIRQSLRLYWVDAKNALLEIFSLKTLSNLVFGGQLQAKIQENVIGNLLLDVEVVYRAIHGLGKLIHDSVNLNKRDIVSQDIKPFYDAVTELMDTLAALEAYMLRALEDKPGVNRKMLNENREIIRMLSKVSCSSLAMIHNVFKMEYPLLGIDRFRERRILTIINAPS